ncbi:MAG TPA: sensor histidine kinase [Polyangiaceae bacterium]|jgi:signal transduction histidine kinase
MDLDALLAELTATDNQAMRDAFAELELGLRERSYTDDELARVADRVESHAAHDRWQVRRAVAHALRFVRSDHIEPILAALLKDENAQVVREAERTVTHRAERAHVSHLPMALDVRMQRELTDLETRYNRQARDAAIRVGLAYTEFMVDAMNHQVKAAMTPVGAALEVLEVLVAKEGVDPKAKEWLDTARTHFGKSQSVLRQALAYVKRTPPVYRATLLREVVDSALDAVRSVPPAPANGFEPVIDIPEGMEIEAVSDLLREALVNVLKNAVEASAARRPIRLFVTAKRVKGNVEIALRDEGCGMKKEEAETKIWRPYGSKKKGGTGLGMPLVKKIVEIDHRGRIQLTSVEGVGTTVTLVLPALQRF